MNTKVNEESKKIRWLARYFLKDIWGSGILGIILYAIMMILIPTIAGSIIPSGNINLSGGNSTFTTTVPFVTYLYLIIFTGVFTLGLAKFTINIIIARKAKAGTIFSGFDNIFRAILLHILQSIFISLWTMLFVIPGIIAAYRYSMSYYILVDDPKKSAMQCIKESSMMMRGNKWKLFCLQLTYMGWMILAYIPFNIVLQTGILSNIIGKTTYSTDSVNIAVNTNLTNMTILESITFYTLIFVLLLPLFLVLIYYKIGETVFYEIASGKLKAVTINNAKEVIKEENKSEKKETNKEHNKDSNDNIQDDDLAFNKPQDEIKEAEAIESDTGDRYNEMTSYRDEENNNSEDV